MSERPPEYHDGRPAAPSRQVYSTTSVRLPVDDLDVWRAVKWREAVVSAVGRLAADGAFAPGDTLRLEQVALPNVAAEGWLQVTARVTVEPAAAAPPPCGCYVCRTLAEMWDNPADAEYDDL
jgi:hypothetical protein